MRCEDTVAGGDCGGVARVTPGGGSAPLAPRVVVAHTPLVEMGGDGCVALDRPQEPRWGLPSALPARFCWFPPARPNPQRGFRSQDRATRVAGPAPALRWLIPVIGATSIGRSGWGHRPDVFEAASTAMDRVQERVPGLKAEASAGPRAQSQEGAGSRRRREAAAGEAAEGEVAKQPAGPGAGEARRAVGRAGVSRSGRGGRIRGR